MNSNKNLLTKVYQHIEVRDVFERERHNLLTLKIYLELRTVFVNWLENFGVGNVELTFKTKAFNPNSHLEAGANQEAIFKFIDEINEDGFYIDAVGFENCWEIYISSSDPVRKEAIKKELDGFFSDEKSSLEYEEIEQLNKFFHSLMGMKKKENVFFHDRYTEFQDMCKKFYKKGRTYTDIISKISTPQKALGNKSPLQVFLSKK